MLTKRYRVIIDVDVDVMDITAEQIEQQNAERETRARESGWFDDVELPAPPAFDLAPLQDLQQRLLSEPAMLDEWLKHEVFAELLAGTLEDFVYEFKEEEFLKKIVERLPPRSRHRLREAIARDTTVEELEPFWNSFKATPKALRIAEID
jgi:hypothetical protein